MSKIFNNFKRQERAIKRIIARYYSRPEDIEDLTQETFLKAFAAEIKTEIQNPKAFLLRVAKNLALSEIKKKAHTTTDSLEDFDNSDVYIDREQLPAEELIGGQRKLVAFSKAMANLPEELRKAFILRKVEKLKVKQIAIRLNVSVSTVEKRVAAALVMCNDYLRECGYDPEDFGSLPTAAKSKPLDRSKPQATKANSMDDYD